MGAWGVDAFDNDDACDWAYELKKVGDIDYVESTLDRALAEGYLDASLACEALAACEVVARLQGNWGRQNPYTETMDAWVRAHPQVPSPSIIQRAGAVIERILRSDSELRELWEESADHLESASEVREVRDGWLASVQELRTRVLKT